MQGDLYPNQSCLGNRVPTAQGSPAQYSEGAGELGTVLISDPLTALT